jgi:hypothetical protein
LLWLHGGFLAEELLGNIVLGKKAETPPKGTPSRLKHLLGKTPARHFRQRLRCAFAAGARLWRLLVARLGITYVFASCYFGVKNTKKTLGFFRKI